ncbi:uncharacterized protein BJ171DRAFT_621882 [Polychytrium aggregatum]|uniref:uncharacterized protein n=1 Tax=Polychytrium aggregatum TaxID=110093 RepID=UPI0022FDD664|nr:uncharacterized protein BJ171DRAFT_621882 [Polychytrium aggregatum]KAI9203978.1 hypothetical protein BJ171DRAFT_621882 [Polychytrium aggregatum]
MYGTPVNAFTLKPPTLLANWFEETLPLQDKMVEFTEKREATREQYQRKTGQGLPMAWTALWTHSEQANRPIDIPPLELLKQKEAQLQQQRQYLQEQERRLFMRNLKHYDQYPKFKKWVAKERDKLQSPQPIAVSPGPETEPVGAPSATSAPQRIWVRRGIKLPYAAEATAAATAHQPPPARSKCMHHLYYEPAPSFIDAGREKLAFTQSTPPGPAGASAGQSSLSKPSPGNVSAGSAVAEQATTHSPSKRQERPRCDSYAADSTLHDGRPLRFGDCIQLQNLDTGILTFDVWTKIFAPSGVFPTVERQRLMDTYGKFEFVAFAGAESLGSISRTVFQITRPHNDRDECLGDDVLYFGQPFRLLTLPGRFERQYAVKTSPTTVSNFSIYGGHQSVTLSDDINARDTLWKVGSPFIRFPMAVNLLPVPSSEKVYLQSCMTGRFMEIYKAERGRFLYGDEHPVVANRSSSDLPHATWGFRRIYVSDLQ